MGCARDAWAAVAVPSSLAARLVALALLPVLAAEINKPAEACERACRSGVPLVAVDNTLLTLSNVALKGTPGGPGDCEAEVNLL